MGQTVELVGRGAQERARVAWPSGLAGSATSGWKDRWLKSASDSRATSSATPQLDACLPRSHPLGPALQIDLQDTPRDARPGGFPC